MKRYVIRTRYQRCRRLLHDRALRRGPRVEPGAGHDRSDHPVAAFLRCPGQDVLRLSGRGRRRNPAPRRSQRHPFRPHHRSHTDHRPADRQQLTAATATGDCPAARHGRRASPPAPLWCRAQQEARHDEPDRPRDRRHRRRHDPAASQGPPLPQAIGTAPTIPAAMPQGIPTLKMPTARGWAGGASRRRAGAEGQRVRRRARASALDPRAAQRRRARRRGAVRRRQAALALRLCDVRARCGAPAASASARTASRCCATRTATAWPRVRGPSSRA